MAVLNTITTTRTVRSRYDSLGRLVEETTTTVEVVEDGQDVGAEALEDED